LVEQLISTAGAEEIKILGQQEPWSNALLLQSINQLHVFPARAKPKKEPLPNHFQWFLTSKAQTHKLGPDTAKTINAQALAWHVSQSMIAPKP
jgi:hypothetical protein